MTSGEGEEGGSEEGASGEGEGAGRGRSEERREQQRGGSEGEGRAWAVCGAAMRAWARGEASGGRVSGYASVERGMHGRARYAAARVRRPL